MAQGRVLDPIARVSEVLFGVIMALTFTGTLSAATADRAEVRTLLIVIGVSMMLLGVVLVAITIALGG